MPGIASIRLSLRPTPGTDSIDALLPEFDTVFTRRTERAWDCLICTDDPAWEDLIARLDRLVEATDVGQYSTGRVTAAPTQPDPSTWRWSGSGGLHSGLRDMYLDGQLFTINVGGDEAEVVAEYSWEPCSILPLSAKSAAGRAKGARG